VTFIVGVFGVVGQGSDCEALVVVVIGSLEVTQDSLSGALVLALVVR